MVFSSYLVLINANNTHGPGWDGLFEMNAVDADVGER